MAEVVIILIFILVAAVVAVEIKSLLSAVVAHAAVGLGLCVVFFALRAPEVAITQLTVELLVLVILLRVTGVKRDMAEYFGGRREIFAVVSVLGSIGVFAFFMVLAMYEMPQFGMPLMTTSTFYIRESFKLTGAENMVSAILMNFRIYDTLGVFMVLFTSVTGVFVVLRREGRIKSNERHDDNS